MVQVYNNIARTLRLKTKGFAFLLIVIVRQIKETLSLRKKLGRHTHQIKSSLVSSELPAISNIT